MVTGITTHICTEWPMVYSNVEGEIPLKSFKRAVVLTSENGDRFLFEDYEYTDYARITLLKD